MMYKASKLNVLLTATALSTVLASSLVAQSGEGFSITVNGENLNGGEDVLTEVQRVDAALADAEIQVTYDGLNPQPRLELEIVGDGPVSAGELATVQSSLNYPAFVSRGEVRLIEIDPSRGAQTLATIDIEPNGQASFRVPEGENLVVVHRVYGADGRFDETIPLALNRSTDSENLGGIEEGEDATAIRNITVSGGAVTVRGSNIVSGASVTTLGERVTADPNGGFVLQRILPSGDYGVNVTVDGPGQNIDLTRDISVPNSEWFYVATGDLTYGIRDGDSFDGRETYTTGRFAGFARGTLSNGVKVTGSLDTGEGDLEDIFRQLDERDPRQLLLRVDPDDLYPTFGDDSTTEDLTPTAGKVYLRVEKGPNYLQWGNFDSPLRENEFVRNERSLYGLSGAFETRQTTSAGEARLAFAGYAAQPERSPGRDVFRGTGGSVFFLEQQDIASGTETVSIQLRDPDTGRIEETRTLTPGADYDINYIQGIVTLARPLQSSATDSLFSTGSISQSDVVLVVAYEHTPSAADIDGYAFGGRAEAWVTDTLRFGVSAMLDETGATDHQVVGVDLLYQLTEQTFARLDFAESEGTGFDSTFSADAGLIVQDVVASGSSGQAFKFEAQASLTDLGLATDGTIGGYFERRTEGFASLDTQVTAATGDEEFWGLNADLSLNDQWGLKLAIDSYENDAGETDIEGTVEADYQWSETINLAFGIETQDKTGGTQPGSRTDVAAKLTYALSDDVSVYAFGQATVDRDGLPENNRLGLGGSWSNGNGSTVEGEISDGSLGVGGRVTYNYEDGSGSTRYVGYEIEPGRTLDGIALNGRDRGRIVAGGRQTVGSGVDMFGENTYDVFGRHRSLISSYGLTYARNDQETYTTSVEIGQVNDGDQYDFERLALTFGVQYRGDKHIASGRLEYRQEDGLQAGTDVTADTLLISTNGQYKINDEQRFVYSTDVAITETEQSTLLEGDYADIILGYAYRPIDNDRLNVLARYRYLSDRSGLRDAEQADGPRQQSQVFSVDASYDLTSQWTVGGKFGYRSAETAPDSESDFRQNDAWLAVANARYSWVNEWDALLEVRQLNLVQAEVSETSFLGAVYRNVGDHLKVGVGYNFGTFSDDLTDLTFDDQGAFINVIAKF